MAPSSRHITPRATRARGRGPARVACAALLGCAIALAGGCARPAARTTGAEKPASAVTATVEATVTTPPVEAVEATEAPAITIGWVGDTTPGSRYGMPPQHGRALFAKTREALLLPDLMVGNLEGTFGTGGRAKSGETSRSRTFVFQAPPANAEALAWAGFDVMSLANNHTYDYREKGLAETRAALEANGISYAGLPGQVAMREVNGVKVAFVAFSPYPRWNASIRDIGSAKALVRKASAKADIVVVLMHVGAEGSDKTRTPTGPERAYGEFRGDPRAFSHAVVDAGADLVLGSGPHVIRGIERYRGRLIAYSLGNFAGWNNFSTSGTLGLSGLLTVRVDKSGEVLGGQWLSLKLNGNGVPARDATGASLKLVRKLSSRDFAETFSIDESGTIAP